jgi:hypothetical protein
MAKQFMMLGLFCLLLSYAILGNEFWFHSLYCLLGALLFLSKYRALKLVSLMTLLKDHRILFSFAFILYFIIGSSFFTLGQIEDVQAQLNNYSSINIIDAPNILMIDALNSFGFGLTLWASVFTRPKLLPIIINNVTSIFNKLNLIKIVIFFIFIGSLIKFYVLNNEFSDSPEVMIGLWNQLSSLVGLGIFLGMLYQGKNQKIVWFSMGIIAAILAFFGLIQFSKIAFISPLILVSMGWAIRKNSLITLLVSSASIFLLMSFIGGAIMYSRIEYPSIHANSIVERFDLVISGVEAMKESDPRTKVDTWARLNYLPAQAAGVELFNEGNGGNDISKILWIFIPRFINSDKPIMSISGGELSYKISGTSTSSEGLGIFIDGYYNAGWLGLICYSFITGFIISQTSKISEIIVNKKSYILYPLIFLGMFSVFRIDGFFMTDILGVFLYIVYFIIMVLFSIYTVNIFSHSYRGK